MEMNTIIHQFEERVAEVEQYLKLLAQLEQPGTELLQAHRRTRRTTAIDETSIKVMRSSALLMIYNLVESAIRSALERIYATIRQDECTFAGVCPELQKLWIEQHCWKTDDPNATRQTYRRIAHELTGKILDNAVIELRVGRRSLSGSLDAQLIRRLCHAHGIKAAVHPRAHGGEALTTVKHQRNALAHGDVSFSEAGQQYTVADVRRIKQQAVVFVRSILRNVKQYVEKKGYAA